MTTGEKIKKYRLEADKTLEEVAQQIGISRQTLSRYETGVIQNIPSDKLESIAHFLRIHPSLLMHWNVKWEPDYYDDYFSAKSADEKKQMLNVWGIPSDLVAEAELLLFSNKPFAIGSEGLDFSDIEMITAYKKADDATKEAIQLLLKLKRPFV